MKGAALNLLSGSWLLIQTDTSKEIAQKEFPLFKFLVILLMLHSVPKSAILGHYLFQTEMFDGHFCCGAFFCLKS